MNTNIQSIPSGYVADENASTLLKAAGEHILSTGCMPILAFSQPIAPNPKPFLDSFANYLHGAGFIRDTKIHTFSLLVLLSSDRGPEELAGRLLSAAEACDGLIFLENPHCAHYAPQKAFALLERLARAYSIPGPRSPLVLKLGPGVDRMLFGSCPTLYDNCFHLTRDPQTNLSRNRQAPARDTQMPPRQPPQTESAPRQAPERSHAPEPVPSVPWYKADPQLYDQEYNGLVNFMARMRFRMENPIMLEDGRLCIHVTLLIGGMGQCGISVIYDQSFSRNNRQAVRLATNSLQLFNRLRNVDRIYDPVVQGHLFTPWRSSTKLINGSSGAAALDALIRSIR